MSGLPWIPCQSNWTVLCPTSSRIQYGAITRIKPTRLWGSNLSYWDRKLNLSYEKQMDVELLLDSRRQFSNCLNWNKNIRLKLWCPSVSVSACFLIKSPDVYLFSSQVSPGLISWVTLEDLIGWGTFTLSFHTTCCLRLWQHSVLYENSPQQYGKSFWRP